MDKEDKEVTGDIKNNLNMARDYLDPELFAQIKNPDIRAELQERVSGILNELNALCVSVDRAST